jgi:hypothetical protein
VAGLDVAGHRADQHGVEQHEGGGQRDRGVVPAVPEAGQRVARAGQHGPGRDQGGQRAGEQAEHHRGRSADAGGGQRPAGRGGHHPLQDRGGGGHPGAVGGLPQRQREQGHPAGGRVQHPGQRGHPRPGDVVDRDPQREGQRGGQHQPAGHQRPQQARVGRGPGRVPEQPRLGPGVDQLRGHQHQPVADRRAPERGRVRVPGQHREQPGRRRLGQRLAGPHGRRGAEHRPSTHAQ